MSEKIEKYKDYAPIILRLGISLVFLWFGFSQILNSNQWIGWVPNSISAIMPSDTVVFLNGSFEVFFGILLLVGFYTRFSAFILGIHLFAITFSIGFNSVGVRDFGLAIVTFVVFLNGTDKLTLDYRFSRKNRKKK